MEQETLLENYINLDNNYDMEEETDRLSFCYLDRMGSGSLQQSPKTPSTQIDQLFTFRPGPAYSNPDTIFYEEELNEYHKRDYFSTIKSHSFHKPSFPDHSENQPRSNSTGSKYRTRSMSGKSRRRILFMFMFGPVKFNPEMELSEIKQRQARQRSTSTAVASCGGDGGKSSRWEVVRSSLKGKSHLTSLLARSFGCIPKAN